MNDSAATEPHVAWSFDGFWARQLRRRVMTCSPTNASIYTNRCLGSISPAAPSAVVVDEWVEHIAHEFTGTNPNRLTMHVSVAAHRNWIADRQLRRGPQGWPAHHGIEVRADMRQGPELLDLARVRHNRVVVRSAWLVPADIDPAGAKLYNTLRDDGVRAARARDVTWLLAGTRRHER